MEEGRDREKEGGIGKRVERWEGQMEERRDGGRD